MFQPGCQEYDFMLLEISSLPGRTSSANQGSWMNLTGRNLASPSFCSGDLCHLDHIVSLSYLMVVAGV